MKGDFWILLIFNVIVSICLTLTCNLSVTTNRIHGENGWYIPQRNGIFKWYDRMEAENLRQVIEENYKVRGIDLNPVYTILYTRSNPKEGQVIKASKEFINATNFNASHPTRITIHGFTGEVEDVIGYGVRDAWLKKGEYNIITVDWPRARIWDYFSPVAAVPGVGRKLARLIDFLVMEYYMKLTDLHIIGHSLGAHIAGYTSKFMKTGKPQVIIGLDPAQPLFSYSRPESRLNSTDAVYVESIQTGARRLGFTKPIGTAAFYPNGGVFQPNCGIDIIGICSHCRSMHYYVEAIEKDSFISIKCDSYQGAINQKCGSTYSTVRMGSISNIVRVHGEYFVPVNKKRPFGKLH